MWNYVNSPGEGFAMCLGRVVFRFVPKPDAWKVPNLMAYTPEDYPPENERMSTTKRDPFKRKFNLSNHPFSGAMLDIRGVTFLNLKMMVWFR